MHIKMLAAVVGTMLLAAAAGRHACLDDFVGAGIAFIAALTATFTAIQAARQQSVRRHRGRSG